jgi:hypothetical protein
MVLTTTVKPLQKQDVGAITPLSMMGTVGSIVTVKNNPTGVTFVAPILFMEVFIVQYFGDIIQIAIKQGYKPVLNGPEGKTIALKKCNKCGAKSAHFISPKGIKWDVCSKGCRTRIDEIVCNSQRSASMEETY